MIKAVVDTNVLVAALSSRSKYHWLIELILDGKIQIYITSEILLEYEEVLKIKYSDSVASNFIVALTELPNVYFTQVFYNWNLIKDEDDNKFVDCYVSAGAQCLLSHDGHFGILKTIPFPKVNVFTIEDFYMLCKDLLENG